MALTEIDLTTSEPKGCEREAESAILSLDSLRRRCLGNEALVNQILRKITPALVVELARLREALEQGDAGSLAAVSHRLKGTAANIGAQRLVNAAHKLEQVAQQGELRLALAHLSEIEREQMRLCQAIAEVSGDEGSQAARPEATT